jgi:hypothetical protein
VEGHASTIRRTTPPAPDNKRVVEVYDYVDANVRMLARMYDRRLKGYGDMGYRVLAAAQRRLNI